MPKFWTDQQKKIVPLVLIGSIVLLGVVSLSAIHDLQGNARVINYTGIVRGATQRLVKQELQHISNDALIGQLDGVIDGLVYGGGTDALTVLPSPAYQKLMAQVREDWTVLKEEIGQVRAGGDSQRLFALSETYFTLVDAAVFAAEAYSDQMLRQAQQWLLGLNGFVILLVVLFCLYDARQRKMREALHEAESASRAKGEFLSRMSHEIRTPMNGILGMTAIAKTAAHEPDRVLDCLDKIEQSSRFLLLLLNDILDMARIESGKVELSHENFDLQRLVQGVETMFARKASDKRIDFAVTFEDITKPCLVGDELRLSQIIINIVSNALKFTPEGGRVTLETRQVVEADGRLRTQFTIIDTGIGMPEGFLTKIFQPFEQATAVISRQYGGTGLGLAISHSLLEMMGGEMRIASTPGVGSKFEVLVYLPADDVSEPADPVTAGGEEALPDFMGTRILLAEDNALNAEIAVVILENTGACVEHVWNGKEVVEKFRTSQPGAYDLILMDIQMPEMDGLAASRAIRALERPDAKLVPILALTANAFQSDLRQALQSGMNGHLAKPIDMAHLYKAVAPYLRPR